MSAVLQSWQTAFDAQRDVSAERREAFAKFLARGLPTTKWDTWKYTDLRRLALKRFRLPTAAAETQGVSKQLLNIENCRRVIFVDGQLSAALSSPLTSNISLSDSQRPPQAEPFDFLNAAFSSKEVRIRLSDDSAQPLYVAYVWTEAANGVMAHPRISLAVDRNAQATLIEHHLGLNTEANFTNAIFDIDVGEHAALKHVRIQDDAVGNFNVGAIRVDIARSGSYTQYDYTLGGALARADIDVRLIGEAAQVELHGLIFARQIQHLDVHTCIEHRAPNTRSREDYRGIADDRGRVVFNGKVIVAKDAQRTDAAQSSRNLLLSPHAEIDTRPELQIDANDVKCAHGATVGQLDAAALFYLQSRGIEQKEARALLTQAFAAELIERAPLSIVREHVMQRLMSRLRVHGEIA
jgi:Fe-S cluster assembly protein SufD